MLFGVIGMDSATCMVITRTEAQDTMNRYHRHVAHEIREQYWRGRMTLPEAAEELAELYPWETEKELQERIDEMR